MNQLEKLFAENTQIFKSNVNNWNYSAIREFGKQMAESPISRKAFFTGSTFAMSFPLVDNPTIVVFYDTQNQNILYIYSPTDVPVPAYFRKSDLPTDNCPLTNKHLLEYISNRVLPNMDTRLTNLITTSIMELAKGEIVICPPEVISLILSTPEHPVTLESMYPRMNDPILDQIRSLFTKYNVKETIPSDITWNKEKTWIFAGKSSRHAGRYIEIEIRHAMRRNDPGMELRVLIPGYARRIVNYSDLITSIK